MEYSNARKVPRGWESLAGAIQGKDTYSFWAGVKAEVTRLAIDKTNLTNVAAVRDRHLAFDAFIRANVDGSFRKNGSYTGSQTKGIAVLTRTITLKVVAGSADAALLDAVYTNASVVHITGSQNAASIVASGTLVDSNANKQYTITITDALV